MDIAGQSMADKIKSDYSNILHIVEDYRRITARIGSEPNGPMYLGQDGLDPEQTTVMPEPSSSSEDGMFLNTINYC